MCEKKHLQKDKSFSRQGKFYHALGTAWCILVRFGWSRLFKRLRLKWLQRAVRKIRPADYAGLIAPRQRQLLRQKQLISEMKVHCRFGIFYDASGSSFRQLTLLHDSLLQQSFSDWILIVSGGDFSGLPEKAEPGPRSSGFPVSSLMQDQRFSHFIVVRPDTVLAPDALFEFADYCQHHPDIPFIYADDEYFDDSPDHPFHCHFKPDFAPVSFRSMNYIGFSCCIARTALLSLSCPDGIPVPDVSSEVIFRLMERHQRIGHIPKLLFGYRKKDSGIDPVLEFSGHSPDEINALRSHLCRLNIPADVEPVASFPVFRLRFPLAAQPLVSILIPTRDHADVLKRCIDSILRRSTYRNFEIVILENRSILPETENYYRELENVPEIRLIRYPDSGPFNYSKLNNYGMQHSRGEYVVFMNNDVEVITPDWLEEMMRYAQQPEIGAVGAKLLFPDHKVQHGGVLVGFMGAAEHLFLFADPDQTGYAGQLLYSRNCSAVTFACAMMRKAVFEQLGGLDEEFALSFNDVDFCLRLLAAGYQIVWDPFAELIHYESCSRGYDASPEKCLRLQSEIGRLQIKWHDFLFQGDPFYNPNLSLVSTRFDFRHPSENRLIRSLMEDFSGNLKN